MARAELATHNVVAAFRDLEVASDAIESLRRVGVPEDDLSILGRPVDDVDVREEDTTGEPIGRGVGTHIAAGGGTGALAGGALGALAGAASTLIPGVGMVAGVGALLGALGGGGAGGTVGAIVEGESALRTDHSWHETFEAIKNQGAVVVGVHSDDPDLIDRALETIEALAPMEVHRVNARGIEQEG